MKTTILAALLAALCGVDASAAIAAGDEDIPPKSDTAGVDLRSPEVVKKGMEMISSTCGGYCHGSEGRGFKGPPLRNRTDLSTSDLQATITFGRKRGSAQMPAWGGVLSEQEIWTAIAAIVSLRHVDPGGVPETKSGSH